MIDCSCAHGINRRSAAVIDRHIPAVTVGIGEDSNPSRTVDTDHGAEKGEEKAFLLKY